jgi:CDP-diacylglycerol--serine O-phosphatidyltransferase
LISSAGTFNAFRGTRSRHLLPDDIRPLDSFDGKIARTMLDRTVNEKRFGIQIDSYATLSALYSSGCLSATVLYGPLVADSYILLIYIKRSIPLAFYIVEEEERQSGTDGLRLIITRLPVTTIS